MNEVMRKAMETKALVDQADAVVKLIDLVKELSSKVDKLISLSDVGSNVKGTSVFQQDVKKIPKAKI